PVARLRDVALGAGDDRGCPGGRGARGDGGDPPGAGQGAVGRPAGAGFRRVPAADAAVGALTYRPLTPDPSPRKRGEGRKNGALPFAGVRLSFPPLPACGERGRG